MGKQEKRYFWLKLHENFFDQAVIRYMRMMPEGDTIVIIYLELLLISLRSNGCIYTDGLCESLEEDLALILDEDVMKVRLAVGVLEKANLLTRGTEYDAKMTRFPEMVGIGSETAAAKRMRDSRERKLLQDKASQTTTTAEASQCYAGVTPSLRSGYTEREKELEKESDIEKEREGKKENSPRSPYGRYGNVYLSDQEAKDLEADYPDQWKDYLEQLSSFMASEGRTYENHAATIRRWIGRDQREKPKEKNYSESTEGTL